MPKSKEATTSAVETEPQAPKAFGFEQAFDDLGTSLKDIIRSHVHPAPDKVDYGQATEQVEAMMRQYKELGTTLFTAARVANARRPGGIPGRDINSLATADAALPGMEGYMNLVRTKVDSYDPKAPNHLPTDDERAFMEAMEWSALREQRLAAPQEITALDYQDSPHDPPYDSYDSAQRGAIQQLIVEAEARRDAATSQNDAELAGDQQRVIDELETYLEAFVDFSAAHTPNRQAAATYADGLAKNTATASKRTDMTKQANLDRIFATYDGQIKTRMKNELDKKDIESCAALQGIVEVSQSTLAEQAAGDLRRYRSSDNPLGAQAAYDIASAQLGIQELRIAQRIGTPTGSGFGEKITSSAQVGPFLATMHDARSSNLDAKIAIQVAEKRNLLDSLADSIAGKNNNGEKEKRKGRNFLRRSLKVGAFAAMASLGPIGFAGAMGVMVGVGKLSKAYSKHSHELQSRTSGIDINKVVAVANNPSLDPAQKMEAMRKLEAEERANDRLLQQKRRRGDLTKAAAWGAGVAFAPVYAPLLTGIGAGAAESGWELTKWTAGRIF